MLCPDIHDGCFERFAERGGFALAEDDAKQFAVGGNDHDGGRSQKFVGSSASAGADDGFGLFRNHDECDGIRVVARRIFGDFRIHLPKDEIGFRRFLETGCVDELFGEGVAMGAPGGTCDVNHDRAVVGAGLFLHGGESRTTCRGLGYLVAVGGRDGLKAGLRGEQSAENETGQAVHYRY